MTLLNDGSFVFIYGARPQDMIDGASKTVLGYEKEVPEKGGIVLMGDAFVTRVDAAEFANMPRARKQQKQ
jgi:hypothetical protein